MASAHGSTIPGRTDREALMRGVHREKHWTERIGWLRAAVLGANDGIISTASLVIGVAVAEANRGKSWLRAWPAWPPERCRWRRANSCR